MASIPSEASRRRTLLYLTCCLPLRLAITAAMIHVAYSRLARVQRVSAVLAAIGAAGFLFRYATFDDHQRGGAGGKVWWNHWRPVHALLFGFYAIAVFADRRRVAPWFLVIDTIIGILLVPTQLRGG